MIKRMVIMLVCVGLIFGGIFGYKVWKGRMTAAMMASQKAPPVAVTTARAEVLPWQPRLKAVGNLQAVRGVDVTSEIAGLVQSLRFSSGDDVREGQVLVQLNADTDIAQLQALEASAQLASVTYERDRKQFAARAVSQATLDADLADLKSKKALAAQQAALVAKKTIRAPFSGRLGIRLVNLGQYLNPGDSIATLQWLDSIHVDFYLPQQELARVAEGQPVKLSVDAYRDQTFTGTITAVNPKVESATRNVAVRGTLENPGRKLLPGMYASVEVEAGKTRSFLTLPRTAVTFNPYGETVYLVEQGPPDPDGKPSLAAKQSFVTVGESRGDQVAILSGVKEGETVVTSGQLKLRNGSPIVVNNTAKPTNDAAPKPIDK